MYSIAKNQVPDMADYDFNANVLLDNSGKVTHIDSTTYGTNMSRTWQRNKDRDLAGYLNVTYTPTIFNKLVEFEAGGLYRAKTRDNYKNDYNLKAFSTTAMPFHTIDQVVLAFSPVSTSTGNVTAVNFSTYTAHENIAAAYLQTKFMVLKKLQLLGGVRVENTQQDYTTVMPITADARSGTINYVDVLPSVHFKYLLKPNQNIRLSYFKSISRPGFGEIVPVDNSDEQFRQIGNPYLMHVRADNIDLRYELFPGHADQLLLGAFYKKLQNPIEYFLQRTGPSAQSIQPGNVSSATNFGFEAVFTKYFGQFGVSANYTYTNSNVTTNKNLYHTVPVAGGGTTIVTDILSQKRPLQGQADNVGNLSLLYKNPNIGLEMQLAFSYTGTRIAQVSQYYNLDIWQKPISQLDFSLEKKLGKRFAFYTKINNLTNQASRYYIKAAPPVYGTYTLPYQTETNNTIVQRNMNKLSFLGGFRFKF